MQTIAIVDYGMGNVRSVQKALEYVAPSDNCILTSDPQVLRDSDRIVFPGQGAMGSCMSALEENSLVNEIKSSFKSKPFLGICLGLQLLFDSSEENNGTKGLSIVPGKVVKFKNSELKIPHMGWNEIEFIDHPLFTDCSQKSDFYFVHSYYFKLQNKDNLLATTKYPNELTAAVIKDNIFGTQFHPEKSHSNGMKVIKNFLNWRP